MSSKILHRADLHGLQSAVQLGYPRLLAVFERVATSNYSWLAETCANPKDPAALWL